MDTLTIASISISAGATFGATSEYLVPTSRGDKVAIMRYPIVTSILCVFTMLGMQTPGLAAQFGEQIAQIIDMNFIAGYGVGGISMYVYLQKK